MNREISWNELSLSHFDPHTKHCEQEVQRIIHLQSLANNLPDAFIDLKRVTKSYIPATNAPKKISVQEGKPSIANESKAIIKRGRPLGSKDKNPQKQKGAKNQDGQIEEIIIEKKSPGGNEDKTQEETKVSNALEDEISLNYVMSGKSGTVAKSSSMMHSHTI